jgi:hypothetical protein
VRLSDKARHYFRTHGTLRVRTSVDTSEQAKPSTSGRKAIAG